MGLKDTARRIPGVAAIEGAVVGALAHEQDLPIEGYDEQNASDIVSQLNALSQRQLRMIDAYERKHQNRSTITDKISALSGEEPWSGYDEQSVDAIGTVLHDADPDVAQRVKTYERDHKDRAGVVAAADKAIAA